jgi:general secretion pathway protein D
MQPPVRPLRGGIEAPVDDPVGTAIFTETPVTRMVLSNQPDQSLQTARKPAAKPVCNASTLLLPQVLERSVCGHLERVPRMQLHRIGRRIASFYSQRFAASRYSRNIVRASVMLVLVCGFAGLFSVSAHAQSAAAWDKRGANAEAREDYDGAFEAYRQAHLKKPKDLRYKTHYERLRFQAANAHVDRGRVLRQSGDIPGATTEFARALQIDPGSQVAAQELQTMEKPSGTGPQGQVVPPVGDEQTAHQKQTQRDIASLGAPVELQPVDDDPITLHMVEDTKSIYQAIGKAAGLNVIFDPDYTSKRIPVDLTSVSLYDALRIVGTLSGTFWKPVTSNTIFVAQNNRTKRTDLDDLAVQTFYLTNVSQQNDANEILVALRNLLDPSLKIYLVASQNALILRATPSELILAEKLINDLDRTKAEVVVDVAILEVSRNFERNVGITLPTSFGLTPQYSNQNVNNTTSSTTASTSGSSTSSTTSSLTLNTLGNLNATNFAVSLSGGTVNALLTDADTRILNNPRIRATDGQHSTLKIGSKIPVATGSYSAGAAITTASLGVQTQFTYLDVGVNIDITPTVHYDREVSLKMKVEVSTQNGSVTISGVTEPIISQRVAEQVIQLKDGEPAIMAGLLQNQDGLGVSGTPGLADIPFLKYFFSSRDKTIQKDDLVFLIIPHIVRESIVTDDNTRAIYTGSGQSIDLIRRDPAKVDAALAAQASPPGSPGGPPPNQTSAAVAARAMVGQLAAQAQTPLPPSMDQSGAGAGPSSSPVNISVVSPPGNQPVGSTFMVSVTAANAHDLFSVPLQMQFDPHVLTLVNVDAGDLLGRDNQAVALVHRDEGNGAVTISASRPPNTPGVNGQGTICTLTFKALAAGDSTLALVKIGAKNSRQTSIPTVGTQAVVHVK